MKRWRLIALGLILGLLVGCGRSSKSELTTLARGTYSGITSQEAVLITNLAQWDELWRRHANRFDPPPARPPVDFDRFSVIALFLGERPTGGYAVTVTQVRAEGERLIITAQEHRPGPEAIVTQALTQPYHMVAIPKVSQNARLTLRWELQPEGFTP